MSRIDAVLFDVDGTLLDTFDFIYQSFDHAMTQRGLPVLDRTRISTVIGPPLEEIYLKLAPREDPAVMALLHRDYQAEHIHLAKLFPSTLGVLKELTRRKIKIAAVTTRSKRSSVATLESTGIAAYFDVVLSAEDVVRKKPDPEPVLKALKIVGVAPGRSIMVGDTESDVMAGKNAGTLTAGVTYGFGAERIRGSRPDYLFDDLSALLPILS